MFYAVSGALWMEHPATRPIWRSFRSRGGRDFMLNSGVGRLDVRRLGSRAHLIAAAAFAAYPLFLAGGYRHGRRAALALARA